MEEQTNALPIFVMDRMHLDSNDANDLRLLLENKKTGFAIQNCIIAISRSDMLVEQQLSEEMPDKIKQWLNHPTIMYVSPIAAIGAKKRKMDPWIDLTYKQIFEKKLSDLTEIIPPNYNETPCGRKMTQSKMQAIKPLLYASGIPSLETEINYYAYRFAEFKKCTNGREYLLKALQLADKKLQEAKDQLEKDKKEKVKEQQKVRKDIKNRIDAVSLPSVNTVVDAVKSTFSSTLNGYCDDIESLVKQTWALLKKKKDAMALFEKAMAAHCQKNLYDAHIQKIKKSIEAKFIELTTQYMNSVKKCVTDQYNSISEETKRELEQLFNDGESVPTLNDVSVSKFEKITMSIIGHIPFERTQELFIKWYVKKFKEKLQGDKEHIGVFTIQCIKEPAENYSRQIKAWSIKYKRSIDNTLNKDNAILSELDGNIKTLEGKIEDMERRLKNLDDVRNMLEEILPE